MFLSIIIPVYNVEKYIDRCLNSVFQIDPNLLNYEVIVVNDGSLDKSMSIVMKYASLYRNLKIYEQKNKGLGAARNLGLTKSSGEYVYFLDSDDFINHIAFVDLFFEGRLRKADVIIGDYDKIMNEKAYSVSFRIPVNNSILFRGKDFFLKHYRKYINTVVWRSIYKREYLQTRKFYFSEGIYFEDVNWTPKVLIAAHSVYYKPIIFYHYVIRDGSIINSSYSIRKFEDVLFIAKDLLSYATNKRNEIQKELGYIAVVSVWVAIGRYCKTNNMVTSLQYAINETLNIKIKHYIVIRILVSVYFYFPTICNLFLKLVYGKK